MVLKAFGGSEERAREAPIDILNGANADRTNEPQTSEAARPSLEPVRYKALPLSVRAGHRAQAGSPIPVGPGRGGHPAG